MPHRRRLWIIAAAALCAAFAAAGAGERGLAGDPPGPVIDPSIAGAYQAGSLSLTGTGFGTPDDERRIAFLYGDRFSIVEASDPSVSVWTDSSIGLTLPRNVQSGQVIVMVNAAVSEPADLLVFTYEPVPIPVSSGTNKLELTVALDEQGSVWINQEYHVELKSVSAERDPVYRSYPIPQAEGPGIFAQSLFGDAPTRISGLGEDVDVANDGAVWFTEGGGFLYSGPYPNTSRILRFDPSVDTVSCYNAPIDNAQVGGVLVDEVRGAVWYAETGLAGGAISGFVPDDRLDNCLFDPRTDPRDPVCPDGLQAGCHVRVSLGSSIASPAHLILDAEGNIWFTEFWTSRVGRLNPDTGELSRFPLPRRDESSAPWVSSAPWEIALDGNGDLWVNEYIDASIMKFHAGLAATEDCEHLDNDGRNPCFEEVYVAPDAGLDVSIHSLSIDSSGMVWFGVSAPKSRIGFISPQHQNAAVLLPHVPGMGPVGGIARDPGSGDIWFAQYLDRTIGRLMEYGRGDLDKDGVLDATDNCGDVPNVGQEDYNLDGLGDACDFGDNDGDGCPNIRELGSDAALGGARNPDYYWDFFDPRPDGSINIWDLLELIRRFGADGDPTIDPRSPAPPPPAYHPRFDRGRFIGPNRWDRAPADGHIGFGDVLALASQISHVCEPGR